MIRKEDHMVWTTAVVLIVLWMAGLGTGITMGSFIHLLYVAAVVLLVVGLDQEVAINRKLKHVLHGRGTNPDGKRKDKRSTHRPISSRTMP